MSKRLSIFTMLLPRYPISHFWCTTIYKYVYWYLSKTPFSSYIFPVERSCIANFILFLEFIVIMLQIIKSGKWKCSFLLAKCIKNSFRKFLVPTIFALLQRNFASDTFHSERNEFLSYFFFLPQKNSYILQRYYHSYVPRWPSTLLYIFTTITLHVFTCCGKNGEFDFPKWKKPFQKKTETRSQVLLLSSVKL